MRELARVKQEYETQRQAERLRLDTQLQDQIRSIAGQFPGVWNDPRTPDRERKRMLRLLIEDVTLIHEDGIHLQVRFRGGATRSLELPRPMRSWEQWKTPQEVLIQIDSVLYDYTYQETAELLNQKGFCSGGGKSFHGGRIKKLRRAYQLEDRYTRLRAKGLLTLEELAQYLGCCKATVKLRRINGTLGVKAHKLNEMGE